MIMAVQKGIRDGRIEADQVTASVRRIEALKAGMAQPKLTAERSGGRRGRNH